MNRWTRLAVLLTGATATVSLAVPATAAPAPSTARPTAAASQMTSATTSSTCTVKVTLAPRATITPRYDDLSQEMVIPARLSICPDAVSWEVVFKLYRGKTAMSMGSSFSAPERKIGASFMSPTRGFVLPAGRYHVGGLSASVSRCQQFDVSPGCELPVRLVGSTVDVRYNSATGLAVTRHRAGDTFTVATKRHVRMDGMHAARMSGTLYGWTGKRWVAVHRYTTNRHGHATVTVSRAVLRKYRSFRAVTKAQTAVWGSTSHTVKR